MSEIERLASELSKLYVLYTTPRIIVKPDGIEASYEWTSREAKRTFEMLQDRLTVVLIEKNLDALKAYEAQLRKGRETPE